MAQAVVNFSMDEELKNSMEQTCNEIGLSMASAFTVFAAKVAREKRIPFELSVDPFYSDANMERISRAISSLESGSGTYHDLIEAEDA
ncbi:MAG: type II toxin-antitoxin system RelB/DinJ family antitoxin [Defluviitaleaceae bacterium]|nr:type II toxin-antitoxin system RelB/DinJ family antitoxin [Defluviitaleaceae bacterium]MCL2262988.1 type II toxin-antitoxin system RelB/DinJ family antitoxin [Defluviitaleaceae bacterium]